MDNLFSLYLLRHIYYIALTIKFSLGRIFFCCFLRVFVNFLYFSRDDPSIANKAKITINDVLLPTAECVDTLGGFTWIALSLTAVFWMFRLIKVIYHTVQYWDIKMFFNTALKVEDVRVFSINVILVFN